MSERFYTHLANIEFSLIKTVELAKKYGSAEYTNTNHYSKIIDQISDIGVHSKAVSNMVKSVSDVFTVAELDDILLKARNKKSNFKKSERHQSLSKEINEILNPSEISNNRDVEYDDDMSIQAEISSIDPITKQIIQYPVKNIKCNHRYEKSAILESIKYNPRFRCPVVGCANKYFITENNLVDDLEFMHLLRRTEN